MGDTVQNGKGSKRRPPKISQEEFQRNWERTFSKPSTPEEHDRYIDTRNLKRKYEEDYGTDL